jgi:hypothetical protein
MVAQKTQKTLGPLGFFYGGDKSDKNPELAHFP